MARKNRSPEENARREKIRELLQMANIGSMDDIQNLFKETIAEFMENGLEAELDEDLGYSRYDYKNKATDNSRNGHSSKTLRTSFGDVEVSVPRDRKGEFEPQVLKKGQTSISQDVEEKILSMYAKGMTTSDIEAHIQDIYGISVSDSTISRITDKILPIAKEIVGNKKKLTWWQDKFWEHMVVKYPDLERGESASQTGRDHIPPRIFKEMTRLNKQRQKLDELLTGIGPLNSKKRAAEISKLLVGVTMK